MGLGSATAVSLADARDAAADAMRLHQKGVNPIQERRKATVPTFGALADEICESLSAGFRNEKHKAQWKMTLREYASAIRSKTVDAVDTQDVLRVLKPIWLEKPETASRLRGRVERVLDAARAKGFRTGENPARWRGHLDNLLPKPKKLARGHHPAMPYDHVPNFMGALRERNSNTSRALAFCILTATRSSEALCARWSEIDLEKGTWVIPAERMKAKREHRVPLSTHALTILKDQRKNAEGEFVFPGRQRDKPLSNMALGMLLRRLNGSDATIHGFRSSFRDWAGNETTFQREIIETALAHVVGDRTEQAYWRSDALHKRRRLMEACVAISKAHSMRRRKRRISSA
jgi:integrase